MRLFLILLIVLCGYVELNAPEKLPLINSSACQNANPVVKLFTPVCRVETRQIP